jgi:small subunit ribosomal protein S21
MLIIPIKDGENIDRALKAIKENLIKQELFVSYVHVLLLLSLCRIKVQKAAYIQNMRDNLEN